MQITEYDDNDDYDDDDNDDGEGVARKRTFSEMSDILPRDETEFEESDTDWSSHEETEFCTDVKFDKKNRVYAV